MILDCELPPISNFDGTFLYYLSNSLATMHPEIRPQMVMVCFFFATVLTKSYGLPEAQLFAGLEDAALRLGCSQEDIEVARVWGAVHFELSQVAS